MNLIDFPSVSAPPSFEVPITNDFDGFQKEAIQMVKPGKGTTSLAFIFKDGVMVVADSRASMGGYICKLLYNVYPIACIYEVVVCFAP
ncbi:hypothetical protein EV1_037359 [Malus domestica]